MNHQDFCAICTKILTVKENLLCGDCRAGLTDPTINGRVKTKEIAEAIRNMVMSALREARAAADDVDSVSEMVTELQLRQRGL